MYSKPISTEPAGTTATSVSLPQYTMIPYTYYDSGAQYAGGAAGAMIIYGPKNVDYDIDLGPVILSDWYHEDYYSLVELTMSKKADNTPQPASNNNLINGKMNFPCYKDVDCTANAGVSKFSFTSGKKHRLRLINMSAEAMQKFSIDGHKMTVIANDFVPVEPYDVAVVTLAVGESDLLESFVSQR
jgi:FtsP/CotA-like multicopper oxidase with cupredoxin domain